LWRLSIMFANGASPRWLSLGLLPFGFTTRPSACRFTNIPSARRFTLGLTPFAFSLGLMPFGLPPRMRASGSNPPGLGGMWPIYNPGDP